MNEETGSSELESAIAAGASEKTESAAGFVKDSSGEVVADKALRRDLDAALQRLHALPKSRERALAITKLQESIMWLGMDLKRLGKLQGVAPAKSALELAKEAYGRYARYREESENQRWAIFEMLDSDVQQAWVAAVTLPEAGTPYPNSYNPENTVVDKTADGLKL